ncbi:MAG: hypothetical protein IPO81_26415 [Kouleothrix sp.]|nr:hypothetical protein [Kouleothrix sp.]
MRPTGAAYSLARRAGNAILCHRDLHHNRLTNDDLRVEAQSRWRARQLPEHKHRRWFNAAAVALALSLAVVSPLACIFHCLALSQASVITEPSTAAQARLVCVLRPHQHPTSERSAPLPAPAPPPALYQLALPLNQRSLVIVALTLTLLTIVRRMAIQTLAAPPTPPPRAIALTLAV